MPFVILDYVKIGAAVVIMAVIGWFIWKWNDMKSELLSAQAQVISAQATINELGAVNTANRAAITELQASNEKSQAALKSAHDAQQATTQIVEKWRTQYVQVPAEHCDGVVTGRDRATLDGVRSILSPGSSPGHPDPDSQGASAGGTAVGHSTSQPS